MSSPKAASRGAGSSGKDPPGEAVPSTQQSNPAKPKNNCWVHLLAIVPIVVAFIIYNLPTIIDEYQALAG